MKRLKPAYVVGSAGFQRNCSSAEAALLTVAYPGLMRIQAESYIGFQQKSDNLPFLDSIGIIQRPLKRCHRVRIRSNFDRCSSQRKQPAV